MRFHSRIVQRPEKTEALDVVHVQMGEQQIDSTQFAGQFATEQSNARTGIEHQHRALVPFDLYARSGPAIAGGIGAGGRQGTTGAPERHLHPSTSQKIATAPRCRSRWPISGNAVTSIRWGDRK